MPLTSTVGSKNIEELYHKHGPGSAEPWPRKRIVAAGLNAARRNKQKRSRWGKRWRRRQRG